MVNRSSGPNVKMSEIGQVTLKWSNTYNDIEMVKMDKISQSYSSYTDHQKSQNSKMDETQRSINHSNFAKESTFEI